MRRLLSNTLTCRRGAFRKRAWALVGDAPAFLHPPPDLQVEELPIAGTIHHHPGEPERFDGWLELIAAIEALLNAARDPAVSEESRHAG